MDHLPSPFSLAADLEKRLRQLEGTKEEVLRLRQLTKDQQEALNEYEERLRKSNEVG